MKIYTEEHKMKKTDQKKKKSFKPNLSSEHSSHYFLLGISTIQLHPTHTALSPDHFR